ncbi:unnamed protein product [Chrysodeixis includens]|uniref:Uncharacterized protein n=1 Tax=Chrysodeixis includens TaxID=689277 RepID=A0A9N8PWK2_CHRIL|nr:unnamed protein product [Chrysodeixis includens]
MIIRELAERWADAAARSPCLLSTSGCRRWARTPYPQMLSVRRRCHPASYRTLPRPPFPALASCPPRTHAGPAPECYPSSSIAAASRLESLSLLLIDKFIRAHIADVGIANHGGLNEPSIVYSRIKSF